MLEEIDSLISREYLEAPISFYVWFKPYWTLLLEYMPSLLPYQASSLSLLIAL
jgi:hypothetical protein